MAATKEETIKIINFMTIGAGVLLNKLDAFLKNKVLSASDVLVHNHHIIIVGLFINRHVHEITFES